MPRYTELQPRFYLSLHFTMTREISATWLLLQNITPLLLAEGSSCKCIPASAAVQNTLSNRNDCGLAGQK